MLFRSILVPVRLSLLPDVMFRYPVLVEVGSKTVDVQLVYVSITQFIWFVAAPSHEGDVEYTFGFCCVEVKTEYVPSEKLYL